MLKTELVLFIEVGSSWRPGSLFFQPIKTFDKIGKHYGRHNQMCERNAGELYVVEIRKHRSARRLKLQLVKTEFAHSTNNMIY